MGFFGMAPPIDWTRPEPAALRDVLLDAYDEKDAAKEIAKRAGLVPGTFPEASNMRLRWFLLIDVLAAQGRLKALVEEAAKDPAVAGHHERFGEFLRASPSVQTAAATEKFPWNGPALTKVEFNQRLLDKRARFIGVDKLARLLEVSRSVGLVEFVAGGQRYHGTGVLIGPRLLLTNQHNTVGEAGEPLTLLTVDFGFEEGVDDPAARYTWSGVAPRCSVADDWAVVELDREVAGRAPLALGSPFALVRDDTLFIIQHPNKRRKQISMEWRAAQDASGGRLQYLVDTQKGSSGSPVLNEAMHLVALHHREAYVEKEDLWRNQGVEMTTIMSGLDHEGIAFVRRK